MDENYGIWVGDPDKTREWKYIPNTKKDIRQAKQDGYKAYSFMETSSEYIEGLPEPIRRGPLFLDFDSKEEPEKAIEEARNLIKYLRNRADPRCFKYWMSGSKGVHIEIPAIVLGAECGDPYLPTFYAGFFQNLVFLGSLPHAIPETKYLDQSIYKGKRGSLIRFENIKRPDGNYKVPISFDKFMNLDYETLKKMTKQPRLSFNPGTVEPTRSLFLSRIYNYSLARLRYERNEHNSKEGLGSLRKCSFINHCYLEQETISEEEFQCMVLIHHTFGEAGIKAIHDNAAIDSHYSEQILTHRINNAFKTRKAFTCKYIQNILGFHCHQQCKVKSPCDLWVKDKANAVIANSKFDEKDDGLYFSQDNTSQALKICTPIKFAGKVKDAISNNWARLIEIQNPEAKTIPILINMEEFAGSSESILAKLYRSGLEIQSHPKSKKLLLDYLQYSAKNADIITRFSNIGWHGLNTYILPDGPIGGEPSSKFYYESDQANSLFKISGTLDDWKENVGKYCQGNSLLVLLTSFALTGPILRLCDLEGGGIHVYGPSSSGKSTCAIVAGSVCGGGETRGFIRSWNTTHNALESIAANHNDNFLVVDEISQIASDSLNKVAYMLSNQDGKARMKSDASQRKAYKWLINYLSTGEVTISEKIEETNKNKAYEGQEIRTINIPIGGFNGQNCFTTLHGKSNPDEFSNFISHNSKRYYGTPIREFIACLCKDDNAVTWLKENMDKFIDEVPPKDCSGQVKRVARKFAQIAVVGELAIKWGIFPYTKNETWEASANAFNLYLKNRGGTGDAEIIKVIKIIKDYFVIHKDNEYEDCDISKGQRFRMSKRSGYTWKNELNQREYLMFTSTLNSLCPGVSKQQLITELDKHGYLAHTSQGKIKDTKSIDNNTIRGLIFRSKICDS